MQAAPAPEAGAKVGRPKALPFHGRQATEANFAGTSESSGGPCRELFLVEKARSTAPDDCVNIAAPPRKRRDGLASQNQRRVETQTPS